MFILAESTWEVPLIDHTIEGRDSEYRRGAFIFDSWARWRGTFLLTALVVMVYV